MSCPAPFVSMTTDPSPLYALDAQDRFWHTNTTVYVKLNWAPAAATPVKVSFYLATRHPVTGVPTRLLFRPNVTSLVFTSANWTRTQPIRYTFDPTIQNKTGLTPDFYDITPTVVYLSGNGACYSPAPPSAKITTRLKLRMGGAHTNYALFSWWY